MFSEYAPACDGMLHADVGIGTCRAVPNAGRDGGPKAPLKPCPLHVSITLHGVIAMNVIGPGAVKILAGCANADRS
jgi:hypothetical protein